MKKILLYLSIFFLCLNYSFSQGYVLPTDEAISGIENYSKEGLGFAEQIPSSKSLVKYVPPIGNQKDTGSCTAWATTYYAASMVYNRRFGITTWRDKMAHVFDPWFQYSVVSSLQENSKECEQGIGIPNSLKWLELYGPKKLFLPPRNYYCNESFTEKELDAINRNSKPFRLEKYEMERAYNWDPYNYPMSNAVVNKVKTEIGKYAYPVVAGFRNFGNTLNKVGSDGIWNPYYEKGTGGHAMTIVGYDDYKNGGSFLIVNSWGSNWGDNGYAWIRYSDFKRFSDIVCFLWANDNTYAEYNQIRNESNFTRTKTNNETRIYEGEKLSGGYTGYAILSYINSDNHYAGWFTNGNMNGWFRVIHEEGFYKIKYSNGKVVESTKLGFAASQEMVEEIKADNDYIKRMFPNIRFKEYNDDESIISETIESIQ